MRDLYNSGEGKVPSHTKCLSFNSDGKYLATGDSDGEIKVSFSKVDYLLDLIVPDMDSLPKVC